MIKFLSDIKPQNAIFILLLTFIIRLFYFTKNFLFVSDSIDPAILNLINRFNLPLIPVTFILSTALVLFTALVLNKVAIRHEILYKSNYLPAYFYILLTSLLPIQFVSFEILTNNLIIILVLDQIFRLYKSESAFDNIFKAAFLTGLSTGLNYYFSIFIVLLIIGIFYFRTVKVRELFTAIIGFIIPVYLIAIVNYLVQGKWFFTIMNWPQWQFPEVPDIIYLSVLPLITIIVFLSLSRLGNNYWKNTIKSRRISQIILIYFVIGILLTFTDPLFKKGDISNMCVPLSIIIAYYFTTTDKKIRIKEIINLFLLICIFIFQYLPFFT